MDHKDFETRLNAGYVRLKLKKEWGESIPTETNDPLLKLIQRVIACHKSLNQELKSRVKI